MNRETLKRRLLARYSTRLHMSLILAATCLVAMISSAVMLHAGLHDMRFRYPVVVTVAYLTFLSGVWVWLRLTGFERASKGSSVLDGVDVVSSGGSGSSGGGGSGFGRIGGGLGKGGGSFDGGGAGASWAESGGRMPAMAVSPIQPVAADVSTGGGVGDGVAKAAGGGLDLGGDDLGTILLLLVLALAIFLASGYLVWMAPEIFTEAAFGAALAGGLAKRSRQQSEAGWVAGVVRKTWWPFAIVLVLALVFASYAHSHHPDARTFREALRQAVGA